MTEAEWRKSSFPILKFEWDDDLGWPSPRKQRLFAVACCRRIWHLLPEGRWRDAVDVAERYADRRAKRTELAAACPRPVVTSLRRENYARVLREFREAAVYWACHTTSRKYAAQAAGRAVTAAAYAPLPLDERYVPPAESRYHRRWSNAEHKELAAQIALVYEVCGNPFRKAVAFSPKWRTSTVVLLAKQMYEAREFSAMPILADALQDAGCDNEEILDHCRDTKQAHVRGCWVVDLVLGKE